MEDLYEKKVHGFHFGINLKQKQNYTKVIKMINGDARD